MGIVRLGGQVLHAVKTTDAQSSGAPVLDSPGVFYGIVIATDGSNDVDVTVHDNASAASGKQIVPPFTLLGSDQVGGITFNPPIFVENGVTVSVSTAGTVSYTVLYDN